VQAKRCDVRLIVGVGFGFGSGTFRKGGSLLHDEERAPLIQGSGN
jgi:hypothetical protein